MATIERARAALERGAWSEVHAALDAAGDSATAEWAQLKGRARYGSGDLEGAVSSSNGCTLCTWPPARRSMPPTPD